MEGCEGTVWKCGRKSVEVTLTHAYAVESNTQNAKRGPRAAIAIVVVISTTRSQDLVNMYIVKR